LLIAALRSSSIPIESIFVLFAAGADDEKDDEDEDEDLLRAFPVIRLVSEDERI
jgi:hypothetical protein